MHENKIFVTSCTRKSINNFWN